MATYRHWSVSLWWDPDDVSHRRILSPDKTEWRLIFSVKEWCDLENRVRVRSRSLEMAPFDRSHTSFYSPSIVTMAISCIVCEIQRVIGPKSRNFYTPAVFNAPAVGDCVGISWRCLMLIKLKWLNYRMVKKLWWYVTPFSSDTET